MEFRCVHNCIPRLNIGENKNDVAICSYCGARYKWHPFGTSWGGYGNGPYYDRGEKPRNAIMEDTVVLWGSGEVVAYSQAAVVEN